MAASKKPVEQSDHARELRLPAEHHEFTPTYNDQDLSEFLFTHPMGDFEFIPLEKVAESGKTQYSQNIAASQAPDQTQKPRRRRSLWDTMKEAFNDVHHHDASEEHTVNSAASEKLSVTAKPNKQVKSQSPVMGGWPLMDASEEQEWCEEFYD